VSARVERSVVRLSIPLKEPFVTSNGVVSERELLLLRLEARDGAVGHGEAAPFEPYDGVPIERAAAALTGGGGRRPPQARAAEEIARLDLHARQEERPLAEPRRDSLPVNMTLAAGPPDEVAERARAGAREGYACFKLKVGLPDDPSRLAALRDAVGPWPAIRVDANGAWTVDEAVRTIRGIEEFDLEFVEQPCASWPRCASASPRRSLLTSRWRRCGSCAAPSSWRRATWST
jgi:L-alanine-DL-glutamate epimerase-like enolase superfamily enzyme